MVFSPAAVFANTEQEVSADPEEGKQVEEVVEEAIETPVEENAPETEEAVPAEEGPAINGLSTEETVMPDEEEPQMRNAEGNELREGETPQDGWNSDRSKYYQDGEPVKGLFKAKMQNDIGALFYADEDGNVSYKEGPLLVKNSLFVLTENEQGHKGFQDMGPRADYTYLFKKTSLGDVVALEKGDSKQTVDGVDYYLQLNGTIRTDAGVQLIEGSSYYETQGGAIQMTVGFTPDHKYYIPKEDGIRDVSL